MSDYMQRKEPSECYGTSISLNEVKQFPQFPTELLTAVGHVYVVTSIEKDGVTIQAVGNGVTIDKLLNTIEELAEDLEDWVFKEYCQEDGKIHPRMERSYNRDMITVNKARALLAEARGVKE